MIPWRYVLLLEIPQTRSAAQGGILHFLVIDVQPLIWCFHQFLVLLMITKYLTMIISISVLLVVDGGWLWWTVSVLKQDVLGGDQRWLQVVLARGSLAVDWLIVVVGGCRWGLLMVADGCCCYIIISSHCDCQRDLKMVVGGCRRWLVVDVGWRRSIAVIGGWQWSFRRTVSVVSYRWLMFYRFSGSWW